MNLLKKDPETEFLSTNFGHNITKILQEVKYLKQMGRTDIPPEANDLFALFDELWETSLQLSRIVEWYNEVRTKANPEEFAILAAEISELDAELEQMVSAFTWEKYDKQYIAQIYSFVKHLNTRFIKSQVNLSKIRCEIRNINQKPLYCRNEGKTENLLGIDDEEARIQQLKKYCEAVQNLINGVIFENQLLLFKIDPKGEESNGEKVEGLVHRSSQTEDFLSARQRELFEPYKKYIDELVGMEIMEVIRKR